MPRLTPEILLAAYARGLFPMGEDRHDPDLFWVDPEWRGILPLDALHVPKRLARTVRQDRFTVTVDEDFPAVIAGCAAPAAKRWSTWINDTVLDLYGELSRRGQAHSVESRIAGKLVGGLYGVSIGAAFFGESMFSQVTDASKVALAHLLARLKLGGYRLLDCQFITSHLRQFGAIEISRTSYRRLLGDAIAAEADFGRAPAQMSGRQVLEILNDHF